MLIFLSLSKVCKLTAPNPMDNMVCIFLMSVPVPASVSTPLLPISWFPATVQNFTCLTPTVTN